MKRFSGFVWFALTLFALVWGLYAARERERHRQLAEDRLAYWRADRAQVFYKDGKVLEVDRGRDRDEGEAYDPGRGVRRERAEGLPVPVVPGSRTTEARVEPPAPPRPPAARRPRNPQQRPWQTRQAPPARAVAVPDGLLTVTGRLSATVDRAIKDARARLDVVLAERLAPDVPRDWKVPSSIVDGQTALALGESMIGPEGGGLEIPAGQGGCGLIREINVKALKRDYGTVYEATLKVDFSPERRAEIVAAYHREEVRKRLAVLGALLAFVLFCLAAVAGYVKADEATKGYYTNRLRLAAVAGVGAAGAAVYRWLA